MLRVVIALAVSASCVPSDPLRRTWQSIEPRALARGHHRDLFVITRDHAMQLDALNDGFRLVGTTTYAWRIDWNARIVVRDEPPNWMAARYGWRRVPDATVAIPLDRVLHASEAGYHDIGGATTFAFIAVVVVLGLGAAASASP